MATSGYKTVKVTSYDSLKFSWERTSYSVANNTSTISWKMELISTSYGAISSSAPKSWSVTVNGTKYSGTNYISIGNNSTKTLASGSTTIKHNSDGSKTFSYSFSQQFSITFSGSSIGTKSGSASGTLNTIPRASTISATSAVVGSASTVTITRKSSSFTHTVTWKCGDASGTIATKTSSTSIKWTLPTSLYAQIGSTATSKQVTLTCATYNGDTKIGDSTTCTLYAKTSSATCAPTLSPTVTSGEDTQTLTGSADKFIRYYSTANVTFGAAARNSATLKSKKVTNSGTSRTTDGAFTKVTSATFTFTATDSRGYSTSKTVTKTLVPYVKLSNSFKAKADVQGNMTITTSGNCYNASFGAVTNTLTVQYRYKVSGGTYSAWTNMTASKSGNTYSAEVTLTGLDYQKTYVVQTRATDKLSTITASEKSVRAYPVFDWCDESFHHHTAAIVDNGKSFAGRKSDGTMANIGWISAADNLIIGGGNYPPNNIYITAAEGGSIYASNDNNNNIYNLLGMAKAMCHPTTFSPTVTAGANYSSASSTLTLVGNCLRLNINAERKTATNAGDITNEVVATITFNNQGKIETVYRVDFPNGITGALAALDAQTTTEGNTTTITVRLCATGTALSNINAYTCMPTDIKLSAFV